MISTLNNTYREKFMIIRNRRGVVGFLLTMAVGAALGAAALVVSSEIKKDAAPDPFKEATVPSSPGAVEKAFEEYQQAYKAYQQAAGLGRADVQKYADAYQQAKRKLEIEIFRNTPGVSNMDMTRFNEAKTPQKQSESVAAPVNSSPADSSNDDVEINPFADTTTIVLTENDHSSGTSGSSPGGSSAQVQASTSQSAAAAPSQNEKKTDAAGPSGNVTGQEDKITGMDYYKVKSGDSLSKICQRYYGDSGMWAHILKYQIPSIAATPNLIFPGQLIALPRGLSHDRSEDSYVKTDPAKTPAETGSSSGNSGNYEVAAAGDESWQSRFQKDYLISDRTLTNTNTMSVADIQRFLDAKGSCLAKPYNGSTPAKMIFDAAKKYGINPQVLLARLQCEQGLISKKSATQKQLDWALGVGCYDSGNWNQKFKGLDKQIEFAAATYRRHYDTAQQRLKSGEKVTMTIDGQSVTVKNAASYAFYKYCPHFQGNKLFYDVWNGYKKSF